MDMASSPTTTTETSDKCGPSNSPLGSDDGESIEALNWSEFEDDDLLLAQEEIGKSGVFKSYLITDSEIKDSLALAADDNEHGDELFEGENGEKIRKALRMRKFPGQRVIRKDATTNEMISSTISDVSLNSLNNDNGSGSQAPVLDEGPIWAKSSNKSYRHRQNRTINQKLTFGVVCALIFGLGIGIGNLIAYNEYEAEFKSTAAPQESSKQNPLPGKESQAPAVDDNKIPITNPYPILKQKQDEQQQSQQDKKIIDEDKIVVKTDGRVPERDNYYTKKITPPRPLSQEPMVDPKFAQQAEILKSVVKSIDELSRKIDQFQNSTRQLGGIIMMKEEDFKPPFSTTEKPITQKQNPDESSVDDQKINKIIDEIKSYLDKNFKIDELEKSNILKGGEKVFEVLNEFLEVYKAENENILVGEVDKSEDPYEPVEPIIQPDEINKMYEPYSSSITNDYDNDETEEDVDESFYDFLRSKPSSESENPSLPPKILETNDDKEFDIEMIEFIKQLGKIKFHESREKQQDEPLDINIDEDKDIEIEDDIILAALLNKGNKMEENIVVEDEDDDVIIEEVVDDDSFKYEEKKEKKERKNKNGKNEESKTKKKNKWKGENSREFIKVDDDDDDDDDDEGKKRYRKDFKKREKDQRKEYKHSKKEEKKYVDGKESSESKQDKNWLENRAQYRKDNRKGDNDSDNDSEADGNGETNYKGKYKNNWQIKRDRIREKIRTN